MVGLVKAYYLLHMHIINLKINGSCNKRRLISEILEITFMRRHFSKGLRIFFSSISLIVHRYTYMNEQLIGGIICKDEIYKDFQSKLSD